MGRQENLSKLKGGDLFDLIVIGGGATGCGTALDAASRGLQVALIEKNDFSEGTSSRSTKLAHGGVRYLKMAVTKLDRGQYNLVRDGLRERYFLLQNAPHLSRRLPLVTPLYRWIDVPYIFAGLKLYDCLSGTRNIGRSRLLKRSAALRRFPMLKANGLKAGVLYFDGQFHDARMAVLLALTAEQHGAVIVNHVAVSGFLKAEGKISGVQLTDSLSGETWPLRARGVINASGPFVDQVRLMDNPGAPEVLSPSTGIHLVLATLCSARTLRMERMISIRDSMTRSASRSGAFFSTSGYRAIVMDSVVVVSWCRYLFRFCQSSSLRKGIKGCRRRREVSMT